LRSVRNHLERTGNWEYRKIRRALSLLSDYAQADAADHDDDLADVAGDFVRYAIDELAEMTEELDDRYAVEEQPPETPAPDSTV
jgi:hypothetical protein